MKLGLSNEQMNSNRTARSHNPSRRVASSAPAISAVLHLLHKYIRERHSFALLLLLLLHGMTGLDHPFNHVSNLPYYLACMLLLM